MIERILENLIINAAEAAADEDGRIRIQSGKDNGAVYISVEDNGGGMTEEFVRERLFKPFQTTKRHGTGLGLWQVKSIADQLGIGVDVENRPARGVKFTIRIPD